MARIRLEHVTKYFKSTCALDDVSLDIADNEFFVIFGPAGAGKTTILNTIAGIVEPDQGRVFFDDTEMNFVELGDRNISMVFENYALYPHLTAYENIASPMRTRRDRRPEEEVRASVMKVAEKLHITELLDRLPSNVSNGQKQRIALGRALVRDPNAFLMDEPLAHLDAKLRHAMRKELKSMQKDFHSTTIYVTHDYTEAMSLADRIAVIREGVIQQIGTPDEVYYTPVNEFVARLFGEPEINILTCTYRDGIVRLPFGDTAFACCPEVAEKLEGRESVDVGLRSQDIRFSRERTDPSQTEVSLYSLDPLGNRTELIVEAEGHRMAFAIPFDTDFKLNQSLYVSFNMENASFFDTESQRFLVRRGMNTLKRGEGIG